MIVEFVQVQGVVEDQRHYLPREVSQYFEMILIGAVVIDDLQKAVEEMLLEEFGGDHIAANQSIHDAKVCSLGRLGFVFRQPRREVDDLAANFGRFVLCHLPRQDLEGVQSDLLGRVGLVLQLYFLLLELADRQ